MSTSKSSVHELLRRLADDAQQALGRKICLVFLAVCLPVEELLREAVLHVAGRGLLLNPTLQQHLLVHLPLLLLLFQVLLHAKPLPVELFVLLGGVVELRRNHQIKQCRKWTPMCFLQEWLCQQ